jgi:tetratricopeptide (TPR) repeat protein
MSIHPQPKSSSHSRSRQITLLVLGLIVLGIIFLLPQFVTEPWLLNDTVKQEPNLPPPSAMAPSTEAEQTRYRQESQSVLAHIIALRDKLLEQNVESWSEIEFRQGLELIDEGDDLYSYGKYQKSLDSFKKALQKFTDIEAQGQHKLKLALIDGMNALESLNTNVATAASELASSIDPDDAQVRGLAERQQKLPELANLLEQADQARVADDLQTARMAYLQATNLDPLNKRAADSLASLELDITSSAFRQHMSRGYAALDRDDFETAKAAFHEADKVYPGHGDISKGLQQVENRQAILAVNRQLVSATEFEVAEEWQKAVLVYQNLLKQDPSLTEAKVKMIPANVRSELDQRLVKLIDDPLKLADPAIYRRAQIAQNDAAGIPHPGRRLTGQLKTLKKQMKLALSPVNVVFESDNQTMVTVYRVAELGQFQQTSLVLKPGRYIAAGTRVGFRDVQVEFTITGEPLIEPIIVRCIESI